MGRKPVSVKMSEADSPPKKWATAPLAMAEIKPRQSSRRRALATFVAVVLVAAAAGATYLIYEQYRTNRLARTVRKAFAARRIEEACGPLRQWLAIRPGSGEAFYYRAWAAMAADQPAEAMQAIERSAKLGFDLGLLNCLAAIGQSRSERFKEAEPILERAYRARLEPQDMVAKELARIYLSSYRIEQAAAPIDRWRKLAPEDPQPYLWRNEIASRGSAEPWALIQNYRAALERDPNLDHARLALAEQLSKDRHFDDAEQEYRTYLERIPKDAAALVGLGRIFFQRGDLDTSTEFFETALKIDPRQPDALKELGQIDLRLGRFQQACDRLCLLTEIQPYEYDVRYSFAQALKLAGDESRWRIESAHAARLRKEQDHILKLRTSLALQPNNPAIRFEVAKWMIDNGHVQEGLNWTAEILRTEPRHGPTHRLLADYYQKQGNPGQANYHRLMATTEQDGGTTRSHPPETGKAQ
jgi:tetratricopeptide (TPR) repeat protein